MADPRTKKEEMIMRTRVTCVEDGKYRAEIWEYDDARFRHGFGITMNIKIGDGVYKDKRAECESLPEALRILAGFIEEA